MTNYIPENHTPNADIAAKVYIKANEELLVPSVSVRLKNFEKLNKITGGFRPKEFTIFCGGTGTGKTTFVANLSADLLVQNVPHFVASVETGHTDFVKRVMSCIAKKDWNTGEAIPVEELEKFNAEHGKYFDKNCLHLSLYENRFSVETLMADIAWMVKIHAVKVAIIDNLNFFLEVTSAANSVIEMDRVTHALIIFCKQVDVHLIMVMHPKKTESGRVNNEFEIKGSSTSVQEAHNILLWNRPHPDLVAANRAHPTDRELYVAKMRRLGKYVGSRLMFKTTTFVSYEEGDLL